MVRVVYFQWDNVTARARHNVLECEQPVSQWYVGMDDWMRYLVSGQRREAKYDMVGGLGNMRQQQ